MKHIIKRIVVLIISTSLMAADVEYTEKGGIGIDGLVNISFPMPQEIGSTYTDQCNLQTIDSIGFPVMCQQFGSIIFKSGKKKLTSIGLRALIATLDPFGIISQEDGIKKRIAVGTGLLIAGATIVATCPPISVNEGFHDLTSLEKLQQAQAFGYIPSAPPNFDLDVDAPLDPLSCTATLGVSISSSDNVVNNFGDFDEREFAYTSPFGSYPSAVSDIANIPAEFISCTNSLLSLVGVSFGSGPSANFINAPEIPNINLDAFFDGVLDLIIENIGLSEYENVALSNFSSWKNSYKQNNPSYCTTNTCQFEHGDNRMTFFENMPASAWGNVTPKVEYYQDVNVMEYFDPEITALPLVVHLEALETGGVTVNAYPPRSFTGSPPVNRNYTFDQSWLGVQDNCDASPRLDFTVADFYPLGNWDIPITVTDRVGNVTTDIMRIVVEDSIPPDLLPLDAVGIPVPDGTTVINFTDPGIGCGDYLCETNGSLTPTPLLYFLYPPTYFDFASITPDIECYVENELYANPIACLAAQLPINKVSLVTWNIADPSGNVTEIVQEVFVREQSSNQIPVVEDVSYIIGQNTQVQLPLSGNDADYDPLDFNISSQPSNGNLDADVEAIFQTRFTTSGMIRSASGMINIINNNSGERGVLLSVPDEKRLYIYSGDLSSDGAEVVNRYDLPTITPSAISFSDTKSREFNGDSLFQVLRPISTESGIWIADWLARKVYRYTYNDLSDTPVEKEIFTLPVGLQQPSGLVVEKNGGAYNVLIADKQDNELWKFELSRTGSGSLTNQTYSLISFTVVGVLPFAVDAMDKYNWQDDTNDFGRLIFASWSEQKIVEFDWNGQPNGNPPVSIHTWDIGVLLNDPDGDGNALPILQDPRDLVIEYAEGSQNTIRLFDQAELKYVEKDFNRNNLSISCGGSQSSNNLICPDPESDVLRFPAMVDILAIEEHDELIYVLDNISGGIQHFYRFDLAGRLDAVINLYDAPSPAPIEAHNTGSTGGFSDFALMDNGSVLLLERKGQISSNPVINQFTMESGVDEYSGLTQVVVSLNSSNEAIALDVNATDIVVLLNQGFLRIPLSNTNNQTQIAQYSTPNIYSDLVLSDLGEIYGSNILEAPFYHVTRFQIGGAFLNFIGDDASDGAILDFSVGATYGKLYFDNSLNKLWVTDFANVFYPQIGQFGEFRIMPRISAFAPDGTLLERLIPDGEPGNFFSFLEPGDFGTITSMAVGPDRFYVAEAAPLHRLHVFDTSPFIAVTCESLPEGEVCQEIGYTPDSGFTGTEVFTYGASDPFAAGSNTATVTITIIDDQQAPVLTCPSSIELEMNDATGFVADLVTPEQEPNSIMRDFLLGVLVSENTDLPVVQASHNIPVALPLGMTSVTYSATDGSNNTGTCLTLITVVDTTAPQISITTAHTAEATALLTPRVNIGLIEPTVSDFSAYILSSDAPTDFPLGETVVTWLAIDAQGNQVSQQQLVIVEDTTPPEFTLAAVFPDLMADTVEHAISYSMPDATDAVGINAAGIVCMPAIGDLITMGPNLVQCNVADSQGNKTSTSFTVNYYDNDSNADGIVDVLDLGSNQFSDSTNGGQSSGQITSFGNYELKVYEAPPAEGVVIGLKEAFITRGVLQPVTMTACNNKLSLDNLNQETILFDDISISVFDHVVITCLTNGYKVFSLLGNNDITLTLPDSSMASSTMQFNNGLIIEGWFATALSDNRGEIIISTTTEDYHLLPGQSVDLRIGDLIFANGFD